MQIFGLPLFWLPVYDPISGHFFCLPIIPLIKIHFHLTSGLQLDPFPFPLSPSKNITVSNGRMRHHVPKIGQTIILYQ